MTPEPTSDENVICGNCSRLFDVSVEAAVAVEYAVVDRLSGLLFTTISDVRVFDDCRDGGNCWAVF